MSGSSWSSFHTKRLFRLSHRLNKVVRRCGDASRHELRFHCPYSFYQKCGLVLCSPYTKRVRVSAIIGLDEPQFHRRTVARVETRYRLAFETNDFDGCLTGRMVAFINFNRTESASDCARLRAICFGVRITVSDMKREYPGTPVQVVPRAAQLFRRSCG